LTAFGLAVEIGDWRRLTGRSIGAYLGLVPTEYSFGGSRSQGGITKTGNGHARRLLIESAWHHRQRITGRRWICGAAGTWPMRRPEPAGSRRTGGCTPGGRGSALGRNVRWSPTLRWLGSWPAGAGPWQSGRTGEKSCPEQARSPPTTSTSGAAHDTPEPEPPRPVTGRTWDDPMPGLPDPVHPDRPTDLLQHDLPQDRVPPPAPTRRPGGHRADRPAPRTDHRLRVPRLRTATHGRTALRWLRHLCPSDRCGRRVSTLPGACRYDRSHRLRHRHHYPTGHVGRQRSALTWPSTGRPGNRWPLTEKMSDLSHLMVTAAPWE